MLELWKLLPELREEIDLRPGAMRAGGGMYAEYDPGAVVEIEKCEMGVLCVLID